MSGKPDTTDHREPHWEEGLYIRGLSYRYRRRVPGQKKPFIDTMGTIPLEEATRKAMRYNLDIAEGRNPQTESRKREATFEDFAVNIWLPKKKGEVAAKSFARYRAVVENFLDFLSKHEDGQRTLLSEIDYGVAVDFKTHRLTTPIAPNGRKHLRKLKNGASKKTIYLEISTLRQLFGEAVSRRLIAHNPFAAVEAKKPKLREVAARHRPLDVEEERALLVAAREWDRTRKGHDGNAKFHDIVLCMVKTGLRKNEVCHLQWTDIDWQKGVIAVQEKSITETRVIRIPDGMMPYIRRRVTENKPDDPLLPNNDKMTRTGRWLGIQRRDELAALRVSNVDCEARTITSTMNYVWKPKGSSGEVPMCQTVHELLTRLQAARSSNFVFAHHDGGRCRLNLLETLKKVQKMAGIEGRLRVHDLRHTTAVRLRQRGTPLETIMGVMRHADIRETLIYAPYDMTEGKKAVLALDD